MMETSALELIQLVPGPHLLTVQFLVVPIFLNVLCRSIASVEPDALPWPWWAINIVSPNLQIIVGGGDASRDVIWGAGGIFPLNL